MRSLQDRFGSSQQLVGLGKRKAKLCSDTSRLVGDLSCLRSHWGAKRGRIAIGCQASSINLNRYRAATA